MLEQPSRTRHAGSSVALPVFRLILAGLFLLFSSRCTVQMLETASFRTGRVLAPSQKEAELHVTTGRSDGGGSFGLGLGRGYEVRAGITYVNRYGTACEVYGVELGAARALLNRPNLHTSVALNVGGCAAETLYNRLVAIRASATGAVGYNPVRWLHVFAPLRCSWQYANYGYRGFAFAPGLGLGTDFGPFFFRILGQYSVPVLNRTHASLDLLPESSVQFGVQW